MVNLKLDDAESIVNLFCKEKWIRKKIQFKPKLEKVYVSWDLLFMGLISYMINSSKTWWRIIKNLPPLHWGFGMVVRDGHDTRFLAW